MKILALEIEKATDPDDYAPHLEDEAYQAWELHQTGVIRELYFRADQHTAVLILECPSVEEARQVLETLPLVQAGLIEFEIIPLIAYSGFARLFAKREPFVEQKSSTDC